MRPKKQKHYLTFDGQYFSLDKRSGYWQHTTTRERMHRYVWKHYCGEIPKGFHIHHIDGNKSNNDISNLMLLTSYAHHKLHQNKLTDEQRKKRADHCDNIRHLTKAWHGSEEGRSWHRKHYEQTKRLLHEVSEYECLQCGKLFMGEKGSKFCSNACKSAYRRKTGVDNVERRCEICGKMFSVDKYSKTKTCSRKCATQLRKKNKLLF